LNVRKFLSILMLISLVFGSLVACSSSETSSPEANKSNPSAESKDGSASKDKTLKVALSVNLPTLDWQLSTITVTKQVGLEIYETLITYDKNYKYTPMLAESYNVSKDGLTTTFVLRKGVKFHNGKEMTADDVVASLKRWTEVSSVAKTTFNTVTSINAKDPYTVEIQSSKPSGVILSALSSPRQPAVIMPKEIVEKAGKQEIKDPKDYIGTGPFKFVEWKQDQYVHLSRFDDYKPLSTPTDGLGGKREALVKDLYFYFVTNAASRIAGLQSGDYDFAEDVPIDNYETLKNDSDISLYIGKPSRMNILFFNNKNGVFSNLKVREAVNTALDLDSIMTAAASKPEFFRIDPGLMFEEQKDWFVDTGKQNFNLKDPEKAKKLLQEAGYNGEKVTILASKEFDYLYKSALVIAEQLKGIGMNINVEVYDWPTLLERRKDPKLWDIFFTYTGMSAHPSEINFVDSRKKYPGWYANPKVDELLDKLVVTPDQAAAMDIFKQIQTLYLADVPTIKLGDMHSLAASRKNVKNFDYFYEIHFWNVSVE
jgi:peptide/nickel transport system substrate-binding protein